MARSMWLLVVEEHICRTLAQSTPVGASIRITIGDSSNSLHLTTPHFFSSTRRVEMEKFMILLPYQGITRMFWRVFMMVVKQPLWHLELN